MKRIVLVFGSVMGIILLCNMIYMVNLIMVDPAFETNDVIGYTKQIIILSLTYFGIRNYRNKQLDGFISFGKAFKIGALIVLIASTIYVAVSLFYYYLFIPDFIDKFIEHVMYRLNREGATAAELAAKTKEMADFKEMYKNPLFVIFITYVEVLPLGLIVAFFSSLLLKRKQMA